MAYTKQTWTNADPATPLSASRLGVIEQGISDAHTASRLISKGLLGAAPSEALIAQDQRVAIVGTLNAATVFTLTGLVAGQQGRFVLTQDATGGRTFALTAAGSTATAITVNSAAAAVTFVDWAYDGTDLFVKGA